jgi:hypothetical protein
MLILQRPFKSFFLNKEVYKKKGVTVKNYFSVQKNRVISTVLFVTPSLTPSILVPSLFFLPLSFNPQNKNQAKKSDSSNCVGQGWI